MSEQVGILTKRVNDLEKVCINLIAAVGCCQITDTTAKTFLANARDIIDGPLQETATETSEQESAA